MEPNSIAANIEDAGRVMGERTSADGDDWRVKIMRRASPAAPQETVAIFDGATMEQLLSPEPWLVKFSGGSQYYSFRVVHAKDRGGDRPAAIYTLPAIAGTPMSPNTKIVGAAGWNGPATLIFPTEDVAPRNGAGKWPGAPDSHTGAPRQPAQNADGSAGSSSFLMELQREREKLADERHRMEMDAVRREAEMDRKRMEERIRDLAAKVDRPVEVRSATDTTETIVKIVTAIGAVLAPIIPIIVGSREAESRREEARLSRDADRESKREARESALMEKLATQANDQGKVIGVFTESLSTVARSMVQTVAMVGELRQPEPQDEGIMGVIRAGIAAWAESQARGPMIPTPALAPQAQPQARPPPTAPAPTGPEIDAMPAGEPGAGDEREVSPTEMIDILANEMREKTSENDLAESIVEALTVRDFVEAIVGEGGALVALQRRLGAEWAQNSENVAYLQRVFTAVGQIAKAKNVDVRPLFPVTQ